MCYTKFDNQFPYVLAEGNDIPFFTGICKYSLSARLKTEQIINVLRAVSVQPSVKMNTAVNETQLNSSSCQFTKSNRTAERITKTFAYCIIFIVSLAGNTFIVIIVYKTKNMRKNINFLIVNMAISDLALPIFAFPKIVVDLNFAPWPLSFVVGEALCKLIIFLPNVSIVVSIQSLVLIAVDRFGAVVFPLRSPLISSKFCRYFIITTWITASILISPVFVASEPVEYSRKLACELRWEEVGKLSDNLAYYILALSILLFCIPFSLILTIYSCIFLKLKSQNTVGEPSSNAEQHRLKRHRNVLKMAIAIVLGFAVCWFPLAVYYIYDLYSFSKDRNVTKLSCRLRQTYFIVVFMAHINCAINPCICFTFSSNFRQGLKRLLIIFNFSRKSSWNIPS